MMDTMHSLALEAGKGWKGTFPRHLDNGGFLHCQQGASHLFRDSITKILHSSKGSRAYYEDT